MKVVISGGLGFIGSRLARAYLERGANVAIIDSLHPQIHHSDRARREFSVDAQVIVADVRDPVAWQTALPSADLVLHMAAETGTGQSMDEIARYTDVNVTGTAAMLDALARTSHNVRTIFLPSSRAIYGEGAYRCAVHGDVYPRHRTVERMREGDFQLYCPTCDGPALPFATPESWEPRPASVYATTKLAQEMILSQVCAARNVDLRVTRYQNVYGPGQAIGNPYTGVLTIFAQQALSSKTLNIYEDGLITRDFVFIDDVIAATLAILDAPANPGITNVGSGVATTLLDIVEALSLALNRDIPYAVSGDFRAGDIRFAQADTTRLRALGTTCATPLREGISALTDSVAQACRE